MPLLSDEELTKVIASNKIQAITLDTSVFDKFGCRLNGGLLLKLNQFMNTPINIVITDIVAMEVQAHIKRNATESIASVRNALANHRKSWNLDYTVDQLGESAKLEGDPEKFSQKLWKDFLLSVNATQIASEGNLSILALLEKYFYSHPPFNSEGKKKAEFPDAIALISLETWAIRNELKVLAISTDRDWERFSETSEHIYLWRDLERVYNEFNKQGFFIAQKLLSYVSGHHFTQVIDLKRKIEDYYNLNPPIIKCESRYDIHSTFIGVDVNRCAYDRSYNIIYTSDNEICLSLVYNCHINFNATFTWSCYDYNLHENIILGSDLFTKLHVCQPIEVMVTFGLSSELPPTILEATVYQAPTTINFGTIPPWHDSQ